MSEFVRSLVVIFLNNLVIGVLIVVAGYYFNRLLEKLRSEQNLRGEIEALRDQTALEHLQRQIKELYSPLLGLIDYGNVVNFVERTKLSQVGNDQAGVIRKHFAERYYLSLNTQISDLIRSKIYLLDSDGMPPSYKDFLQHAAMFECLHSLWEDMHISSDDIQGFPYPSTFKAEVEESLDKLRSRYNNEIKQVRESGP